MAMNLKPFDMQKIIEIENDPKGKKYFSKINEETIQPESLRERMMRAESSEQIEQAAKDQTLDSEKQALASLYDPSNRLRETYLRIKYGMYLNQKVRSDFAKSILHAKNNFSNLQAHKVKLVEDCENFVRRYTAVVPSEITIDFLKISQQKEAQAAENSLDTVFKTIQRLQAFDPKSEDVETFNDELNLQIQFLRQQQGN